ncbi:hypothetical protein BKA63DRAFT_294542 [Paraphoma chrysanthemicola]|nr:hypothetical protein BKA63DRAFT_294542 [Paraphoma chrysanthemicola]
MAMAMGSDEEYAGSTCSGGGARTRPNKRLVAGPNATLPRCDYKLGAEGDVAAVLFAQHSCAAAGTMMAALVAPSLVHSVHRAGSGDDALADTLGSACDRRASWRRSVAAGEQLVGPGRGEAPAEWRGHVVHGSRARLARGHWRRKESAAREGSGVQAGRKTALQAQQTGEGRHRLHMSLRKTKWRRAAGRRSSNPSATG